MPPKKKPKTTQTWAFIDTNIYLDFYRSNKEARLKILDKLKTCSPRIISTYQVEMEFLKNRQSELLKSLSEIKSNNITTPAVVSDGYVQSSVEKIIAESKKRDSHLKKRVERMLKQPKTHDRVYKVFDAIFSSKNDHVLTRDMKERHMIKRQAWRRFMLGYPPRKKNDTSIGDALNWEWIIHCAKNLSGKFYIVTRDSDFGCEYQRKAYLNDQLKNEFRDRVGQKSIELTNRLSDVLKSLEVHVTDEELAAEDEMISWNDTADDYDHALPKGLAELIAENLRMD
jgi:predicted nucleic acid-binding protein